LPTKSQITKSPAEVAVGEVVVAGVAVGEEVAEEAVGEVVEEGEGPTETSMPSKLTIGYSMPTKIGHDACRHIQTSFFLCTPKF
jgi:hypothetical protein